jgi:hypothetical protein
MDLVHEFVNRQTSARAAARRYIQSHTADTPLNEQFARSRGMGKAYGAFAIQSLMPGAGWSGG